MLWINLVLLLTLAWAEVRVDAIVMGRVKALHVRVGQKVKKGQLLVEIDSSLYEVEKKRLQAQLKEQGLRVESVKRDFDRYQELYNRGFLSRSELEDWQTRYHVELSKYQQIQAQIERLDVLIDYCKIRSPVDGRVKKFYVREGSFVNGTQTPQALLELE
ncbi:efflux RND transporter periplasmic adaptor subunit [Thermocrinis minervae]|uniref:RND family efflux transporter, MFP subunit n=1 Tax=Thermocrinis minervae TaxID=381751 RepID=A0A1M6QPM7_9AQUI|nr:efflux RND transporter periplasmic adaptor subunit [Thermocrinis minervae]SHK22211.1 RND family efflux transporter, MFP subunit [Thermocrinis minervae]